MKIKRCNIFCYWNTNKTYVIAWVFPNFSAVIKFGACRFSLRQLSVLGLRGLVCFLLPLVVYNKMRNLFSTATIIAFSFICLHICYSKRIRKYIRNYTYTVSSCNSYIFIQYVKLNWLCIICSIAIFFDNPFSDSICKTNSGIPGTCMEQRKCSFHFPSNERPKICRFLTGSTYTICCPSKLHII